MDYKINFMLGDKTTGVSTSGVLFASAQEILDFINDEPERIQAFNKKARMTSGLFPMRGSYGFYIPDEVCKALGVPDMKMTLEEFRKGFYERFSGGSINGKFN